MLGMKTQAAYRLDTMCTLPGKVGGAIVRWCMVVVVRGLGGGRSGGPLPGIVQARIHVQKREKLSQQKTIAKDPSERPSRFVRAMLIFRFVIDLSICHRFADLGNANLLCIAQTEKCEQERLLPLPPTGHATNGREAPK